MVVIIANCYDNRFVTNNQRQSKTAPRALKLRNSRESDDVKFEWSSYVLKEP